MEYYLYMIIALVLGVFVFLLCRKLQKSVDDSSKLGELLNMKFVKGENGVQTNYQDFYNALVKNFGKEYKVTGKPVVSGNYVNFQVGEVTYNLYLSNADKETLKAYADKEIEIVVLTYNYKGKINLFADVTTIVEK